MRERLTELLDDDVVAMTRWSGGDVAESFRVELASGRIVFAKTHHAPPPGFFTTEAAGLGWLREGGAMPVPEVLAVSDGDRGAPDVPLLALEWIDEGDRPPDETSFGHSLAKLHRLGARSFGREDRRTTGSRALPNEPCDTWVDFYASQRLEPLHRLAANARALPDATLDDLATVTRQLDQLGVPVEPPARLHGDLWAGNRLVDATGRSWLIDPAAHGGHREFDLAMMRLFGGFTEVCFEAYADEFPLADGWERRIPLHQLAPLVVHAIKFGGGYRAAAGRALEAVLRS